jgi:SAM-dependent methyltransferase
MPRLTSVAAPGMTCARSPRWSVPRGRVVGVDRSEDLVAEAHSRTRSSPGVEVLVGDAQALPFSENEFSAARVERVLMHVDEPRAVLRELARVTRPAGRVVVTEPDWDTLIVDSDDLGMARRVARAHAERIRHPDIGRRLTRLASQAGLEISAVTCTTIPVYDVSVAEAQFQLLTAVGNVGEDAQSWWQRLIDRSPSQPFFAAVTAVTVVAFSREARSS